MTSKWPPNDLSDLQWPENITFFIKSHLGACNMSFLSFFWDADLPGFVTRHLAAQCVCVCVWTPDTAIPNLDPQKKAKKGKKRPKKRHKKTKQKTNGRCAFLSVNRSVGAPPPVSITKNQSKFWKLGKNSYQWKVTLKPSKNAITRNEKNKKIRSNFIKVDNEDEKSTFSAFEPRKTR